MSKTSKPSPIRRMLSTHRPGCSIRRFSDGPMRRCSCGRDQAEQDYRDILEILQNVLDFDISLADVRRVTIQRILSSDTPPHPSHTEREGV